MLNFSSTEIPYFLPSLAVPLVLCSSPRVTVFQLVESFFATYLFCREIWRGHLDGCIEEVWKLPMKP